MTRKGAVFLDRDGTVNLSPPEGAYITQPDELILLPGAAAAIAAVNAARHRVIVVTNQRGIARGYMNEVDLARVHERLHLLLAQGAGATVDGILYCPHNVGECDCRKPGIKLFRMAQEIWPDIDLAGSVMIGDSLTDVKAATTIGMGAVQLGRDAANLRAAVRAVLARSDTDACAAP